MHRDPMIQGRKDHYKLYVSFGMTELYNKAEISTSILHRPQITPQRMRKYNFFPIAFLLFWVGLFIVGFAVVSFKSDYAVDPLDGFDDVRSGIVGALTHDDVMETSDDIILNNEDGVDITTRPGIEFEQEETDLHLQEYKEYNQVETIGGNETDTYPHGDLKLDIPDTILHDHNPYFQEAEFEAAANFPSETKDDFGTEPIDQSAFEADEFGGIQHEIAQNTNHLQQNVDTFNPAASLTNAEQQNIPSFSVSNQENALPINGVENMQQDSLPIFPIEEESPIQSEVQSPDSYVPLEAHDGTQQSLQMDLENHEDHKFHQTVELDPGRFSLHVTNHMLDHFQVKLPPLLEGYKNPCWLEQMPEDFTYADSYYNTCNVQMHTGEIRYKGVFETFQHNVLNKRASFGTYWRIRCFPYFFLLGVGKCGTTDLFMTLKAYAKHLAPSFLKEPHFWEWKRCHQKMHCHGQQRNPTFAEYLDALDPPSEKVRQDKVMLPNGTEYHPLIIGDFTPSSLTFYPCWSNLPGNVGRSEPVYSTPHYLHSIRPQTKFIVSLRDPVERIFSNYKMKFRLSNKQGDENARMFHAEMLNATTHFTECMLTNTPRACAYSVMRFDFMTHVTNSMYEIFITDWLSVFPRDQFLFIRMEDYMVNRVPHVNAILEFLDQEPLSAIQQQEVAAKDISNKAPATEEMFEETRDMLRNFFRPFNNRLVTLLNNAGYTWGY